MAEKGLSMLLPVVAAAVVAGLGRLVIRKVRSDRARREHRIDVPLDDHIRARISELVRRPSAPRAHS
jgi:hypothetical protein